MNNIDFFEQMIECIENLIRRLDYENNIGNSINNICVNRVEPTVLSERSNRDKAETP
jgi:hypothetical protein